MKSGFRAYRLDSLGFHSHPTQPAFARPKAKSKANQRLTRGQSVHTLVYFPLRIGSYLGFEAVHSKNIKKVYKVHSGRSV